MYLVLGECVFVEVDKKDRALASKADIGEARRPGPLL